MNLDLALMLREGGSSPDDQPTFKMNPGMALELENFEPDAFCGYRRINGFTTGNSNIVPQTSASTEKVLMSAFFERQ